MRGKELEGAKARGGRGAYLFDVPKSDGPLDAVSFVSTVCNYFYEMIRCSLDVSLCSLVGRGVERERERGGGG